MVRLRKYHQPTLARWNCHYVLNEFFAFPDHRMDKPIQKRKIPSLFRICEQVLWAIFPGCNSPAVPPRAIYLSSGTRLLISLTAKRPQPGTSPFENAGSQARSASASRKPSSAASVSGRNSRFSKTSAPIDLTLTPTRWRSEIFN